MSSSELDRGLHGLVRSSPLWRDEDDLLHGVLGIDPTRLGNEQQAELLAR